MALIKDILRTMDYGPSPESSEHVRAWLKQHKGGFGCFVNGRFTTPGPMFDVFDPATGERIAGVTHGASADIGAAVAAARKAPRRAGRPLAITRPSMSPSVILTTSAPETICFRGSMAGLCTPLSTLHRALSRSSSIGTFWSIPVRLPDTQIIDFARVSRRTPGAVDK